MKTKWDICVKSIAPFAVLILAGVLPGCASKPAPMESFSNAPKPRASRPNMTEARRLSAGANKLVDALTKPTETFHFSFKGEQNLNDKYPEDKTQSPKVGPVTLEMDVSPEVRNIVETRGETRTTTRVAKTDEVNNAMANLALLGVMSEVNFSIALGSAVASSPSSDAVGTVPADKFTFDTSQANPTQKTALDIARAMLTTIQNTKGSAWIARDSGRMIKFNIDTDYEGKDGHAWKEHYEGDVTPK